MKYEITQEQYVSFLNTLTRGQQSNRVATDISGTSITNRYVMSNLSYMQYHNGIRCDATIPTGPTPVTFYCDFNGNGTPNENGDGQNIACNYLSWADGTAYADWSGLRPMTELEFEKACRGTASPVPNEYAWGGNTSITQASAVSNAGAYNESVSGGNCNYTQGGSNNNGPIRVGIFPSGTRTSTGGSYYGIMEMSGDLWEQTITIGNNTGRTFDGLNGDGTLDATGNSNTSNWAVPYGTGVRGGSFLDSDGYCRISDRVIATSGASSGRTINSSFRCVSTAP